MKNYLFQKKPGEFKVVHITLFIPFLLIGFGNTPAYSQGMGMKKSLPMDSKQTLTDQISEIRSKVFRLETVLEKKHQGSSGRIAAGMGPMGTMQPNGMKGGPMRNGPNMTMPPVGMAPGPKMQGM